jgi:trehalose-6-phosphate synthase
MLGIDTLDPTKGLVHKFLAVEELFERHPELADELVFAQVRSRVVSTDVSGGRKSAKALSAEVQCLGARRDVSDAT